MLQSGHIVAVDPNHVGAVLFTGVQVAVSDIEQGEIAAVAAVDTIPSVQVLAGGQIYLVHIVAVAIQQQQGVVVIIQSGGTHGTGFQLGTGGPSGIVAQIPGEEFSLALGIMQSAVQGDLHRLDCDHAGGADGRIFDGGGSDVGSTLAHSGDETIVADGGHVGVVGGPGHGVGLYAEGLHAGGELGDVALEEGQGLGVELHGDITGQLIGVQVQLVGDVVLGVVVHLQQQMGSRRIAQRQGEVLAGTLGSALGRTGRFADDAALVVVQQGHGGHILVVAGGEGQDLVALGVGTQIHIGDGGSRLIHDHAIVHGSAVGQSIPIHGGVAVLVVAGVVLRGQSQVHIQVGAVSCVGGIAHVQGVLGVGPSGTAAVVEGGIQLTQFIIGG